MRVRTAVSIVTSLQTKQPRNHGFIQARVHISCSVQTGFKAHAASCSVGNVSKVMASAIGKHQWSMLLRIFSYSQ